MSISQMEVFNKYYLPATIETLAQLVDKFNTASAGAIRLTTEGFEGDFLQESFYAAIGAARRRVDRYAAQAAAAATDLTQLKHSSVKVAGGFGPVRYEPSQMTWLSKPTTEGVEIASSAFANLLLQDQLNTSIAALVAAISNQGAVATVDVSATDKVTYAAVNDSHALFGDHSSLLIAQIMDGVTYHGFIGQNISNSNNLFLSGTVRVVDILGKVGVVTDAPALYSAASGTTAAKRRVLSLVAGAATVTDSNDVISNIQTLNGQTRIETTLQMDYTFGLGLKGYTWDEANGGKSPSDEAIATGSNWDVVVSSIKQTAGVLTIGAA
jgi:hypothetical protein